MNIKSNITSNMTSNITSTLKTITRNVSIENIITIMCFFIILYCIYKALHPSRDHFSNERNIIKNKDLKICICMSDTPNIHGYSKLSEMINGVYAKKHGYDFKMFNTEMKDRAPQWCKIKVIKDLLDNNNDYDYLFWIDADAFFNKQEIPLEQFINDNNDSNKDERISNIIICDDIINSGRPNTSALINTGAFFVKCNEWSKKFFDSMWNYKGEHLYKHFHEQTIMEYYIDNKLMDADKYIDIRKSTDFNTEFRQLNDGSINNNFVIHLMALPSDFRINFMSRWINNNI